MYYSKELENVEGNLNATWNVINKLINKDKPHNNIDNLKIENKEITQPAEIAQAFIIFYEHWSRLSLKNK